MDEWGAGGGGRVPTASAIECHGCSLSLSPVVRAALTVAVKASKWFKGVTD